MPMLMLTTLYDDARKLGFIMVVICSKKEVGLVDEVKRTSSVDDYYARFVIY